MEMQNAVDYNLLHFFRKKVRETQPYDMQILFKGIFCCQNRAAKYRGHEQAVFLMKDVKSKNKAAYFGLNHCHNAFFCPVCTERMMAKHRKKIQSALEALSSRGYKAMMFTFVIPHNRWFSCEDAFLILKNSMSKLQKHWGDQSNQKKFSNNAWTRLRRDMNLKYYVRATEFTYGRNGWNPHYHALYWTNQDFSKMEKLEPEVLKMWLQIVEKETLKQLLKSKANDYTQEEIKSRVEEFFTRAKLSNNGTKAFFVSKDENNKIIEMKSSEYICGWGADDELTGLKRKTGRRESSFTPHQLLEIAAGEQNVDYMPADKAWNLFIEYASVTKKCGAKRVKFSQNKGETIKSIVTTWQQTHASEELIKKKRGEWVAVCWFSKEQWWKISEIDRVCPIKSNILCLAHNEKLLKQFLESFQIYAFDNYEHSLQFVIEDVMSGTNNFSIPDTGKYAVPA